MSQDTPKKPKRRWLRLAILTGFAILLITSAWWLIGPKIWTDDRAVRVVANQAAVRDVLWDPPRSLGPEFESGEHQYEPYLSPDGTEFYFVRNKPGHNADIYVSYRRNNQWTPPAPLDGINSEYDDLGPRLTPDGKFLLFYSDRPGGFGGYDIWASARTTDGWGTPFNLGPRINSEYNEFSPDPTPDGKHLIFSTNRKAAQGEQKQAWRATIRQTENGDYDLWIAEVDPNGIVAAAPTTSPAESPTTLRAIAFAPSSGTPGEGRGGGSGELDDHPQTQPAPSLTLPRSTGGGNNTRPSDGSRPLLAFHPATEIANVNTPYMEGASCMSPAGDFLYFASNRPGGFGKFDIYRSRVFPLADGQWRFGKPENVGPQINTADNETDPSLALNGFRLYLSTDRNNGDGVYHLLLSDSREVYPIHQSRGLPHLSQSFWLMLISILVLIPLLLFLRGWDDRKLGILQRCLLLSLLVHALICFALSFVNVTAQAYHFVRQEMGVELAVSLSAPREFEVGYAVRRQSTSDLPVTGAAPQDLAQSRTPIETIATAGPVDVNVPTAHVQPGDNTIMLQATPAPPTARPDAVAVEAAAPLAEEFDLRVSRLAQVSAAEVQPPAVNTEQPQVMRSESNTTPKSSAIAVQAPSSASDAQRSANSSIQSPAPIRSMVQPTNAAEQNPTIAASAVGQMPDVSARATESRQAANEPSPAARAADATGRSTVAPLSTDRPQSNSAARAVEIAAAPAAAQGMTTTIVPDPPGGLRPQAGPVAEAAAAPGTADLLSSPPIGVPRSVANENRVTSAKVDAPAAQEATVASVRQSGPSASSKASETLVIAPPVASSVGSFIGKVSLATPATQPIQLVNASENSAQPSSVGSTVSDAPYVASVNVTTPQKLSAPNPVNANETARADVPGSGAPLGASTEGNMVSKLTTPAIGASVPASSRGSRDSSIASAALASRSAPVPTAESIVSTIPGATDRPTVALPKGISPSGAGGLTRAGGGAEKSASPDMPAFAAARTEHGLEGGGARNVAVEIGRNITSAPRPFGSGNGFDPLEGHPRATELAATSVAPDVAAVLPAQNDIGPTLPSVPDSPFKMRAPEVHKPIIEQLGGTKESETAVERGLAYLASVQEEDGRWSFVNGNRRTARNSQMHSHDSACSGLSILAFLAQDHRPDKPGPYQQAVAKSLDFLLSHQTEEGDLRGPHRGGGADNANMYDHAIATLALAEAALMTRDPRYTAAALAGARFIVDAQDPRTGGWRYIPGEQGDSSVFGWQIMALHSAEQLGFEIPTQTRRGAIRYIAISSRGDQHMLAGYQPRESPTAPMTAEITFARMLLGQQLNEDEADEVSSYLGRQPPQLSNPDVYYWYYGSLCMMQMQTDSWKSWNTRTRDMLIRTQYRSGNLGYWDNLKWGDRGGRVFTTAMATLTLEVYYRYMPLQQKAEDAITAKARN